MKLFLRLVEGTNILDIGCGLGKWGYLVKIYYEGFLGREKPKLVGVDVNRSFLYKVRYVYDEVVLASATHLPFRDKQFDTVMACEVIEHLPRSEGFKLITECERVASKRVIVTTPSPRTVWLSPSHVSSWSDRTLKELGYDVYGVRCYPRLTSKNLIIQLIIAFILGPLSFWFPRLSSNIVAVKHLDLHSKR